MVPAPSPRVVVAQALVKGDRGELAVELATEAGVDALVPWTAARCVARWADGARGDKGLARWQRTAREAAKQARRAWVPPVAEPVTTRALAARVADGRPARWCCTRRDGVARRGRAARRGRDPADRRARGRGHRRRAGRAHRGGRHRRAAGAGGAARLDRRRRRPRRPGCADRPLAPHTTLPPDHPVITSSAQIRPDLAGLRTEPVIIRDRARAGVPVTIAVRRRPAPVRRADAARGAAPRRGGRHPRRVLAARLRPVARPPARRRPRRGGLRGVEHRVPPRGRGRRLARDVRRRRRGASTRSPGPSASAGAELPLDRVVALGHSAGGHLAAWLAARPGLPPGAPGRGAAGRAARRGQPGRCARPRRRGRAAAGPGRGASICSAARPTPSPTATRSPPRSPASRSACR